MAEPFRPIEPVKVSVTSAGEGLVGEAVSDVPEHAATITATNANTVRRVIINRKILPVTLVVRCILKPLWRGAGVRYGQYTPM